MPGLNKQGPKGSGPMTGQQQGMCRRTGDLPDSPGGRGRGMGGACRAGDGSGQGKGQGRGSGQGRFAQSSPAQSGEEKVAASSEIEQLKNQYEQASRNLEEIAARIRSLESAGLE